MYQLVPEALGEKKEKPKVKRRASGLCRWESHFHVGISWFRFWTLSLIGFLNSYPGVTMVIWYNNDSYWLSICRHESKVDNMEVRFSTANARGLSLHLGFFLFLSLSLLVRASGIRILSQGKLVQLIFGIIMAFTEYLWNKQNCCRQFSLVRGGGDYYNYYTEVIHMD